MTSQVSLSRRTEAARCNPWLHSFGQGLREGWAVAAVACLVYILAIAGPAVFLVWNYRTNGGIIQMGDQIYKYSLIPSNSSVVYPVLLLIVTLVQGILAFRFLFGRKQTNAWFSLGLRRTELFWSRFLAGAVLVLAPVFVGMAASLAVNLAYFPNAGLIFAQWLKLLAGMLTQAAVLYGITAAACSAVGTVTEAIGCSFVMACLPSALLVGLNALMSRFLFGCGVGAPDYVWTPYTPQLVADLGSFNPLLFLYRIIVRYGESNFSVSPQAAAPAVSVLPIIAWAAMAVALAFLACLLFRRRRAEAAGMLGFYKVLPHASVFVVAFFAFSVPYLIPSDITHRVSDSAMLLVSCLASAGVFFLLALPLRLAGRKEKKGFLALPVGLVAALAVVGLLYSGCFGYSSFVPQARDVSNVSVSYLGIPGYVPNNGGGWSNGWINYSLLNASVKLSDPSDMGVVTALHQEVIKSGRPMYAQTSSSIADKSVNTLIRFDYAMKSGATVTRYYPLPKVRALQALLPLDNTKGVMAEIQSTLKGGDSKQHPSYYAEQYIDGPLYLSTSFNAQTVPLTLDAAKRSELLACVAGDIDAQSVEDRYYPAKPDICVLRFADPNDTHLNDFGVPQGSQDIYVTESFSKTLKFLNDNGFAALLSSGDPQVESLEVLEYNRLVGSSLIDGYSFSPLFRSGIDTADDIRYMENWLHVQPYAVTDGSKMNDILAHCHMQYFTSEDGYLVLIKYKGQDMTASTFLPMKDAPDFVKQGAK